jgi:hypothetical protein
MAALGEERTTTKLRAELRPSTLLMGTRSFCGRKVRAVEVRQSASGFFATLRMTAGASNGKRENK